MDTDGTQLIPWDELKKEDVVIIPAFGTTLEIEHQLLDMGIEVHRYNTTCPFVEKVWNRAGKLGKDDYTVIIHGKPKHEETRATFSHSAHSGPSIIVKDINDARVLGEFISGDKSSAAFEEIFAGRYSGNFNPDMHLQKVGVVNQTTMLASETQEIADYFKNLMIERYGIDEIRNHFADTRDTLCYATNDNQDATYELLKTDADLAVVVGGYNSSNTSHIVELCERRFPTYFINSDLELKSKDEIHYWDFRNKQKVVARDFIPSNKPVKIILTSGASCPDTLVDRVLLRILEFFEPSKSIEEILKEY